MDCPEGDILTYHFQSDTDDEEEIAPVVKRGGRKNATDKGKEPANRKDVKGTKVSVSVTFVVSFID